MSFVKNQGVSPICVKGHAEEQEVELYVNSLLDELSSKEFHVRQHFMSRSISSSQLDVNLEDGEMILKYKGTCLKYLVASQSVEYKDVVVFNQKATTFCVSLLDAINKSELITFFERKVLMLDKQKVKQPSLLTFV